MPGDAAFALAVLVLEACVGYPTRVFATIGHPVTWIGRLIDILERAWNQPRFPDGARRALGIVTVILTVGLAGCAGLGIARVAGSFQYGTVLAVIVASAGLAQRSLYEHVRVVQNALLSNDLEGARKAVGRIVGRDTASLSAEEVSAAAIESLAESFNDAVVAPAFWLLVGGIGGLFAYKAVNTADSMIGHREPRWRDFGWAAARLDDVANFIPARIAGALLALAGTRTRLQGFRIMWRDAPRHASPNAGWPEAAAAGALDLRLGGEASYDGVKHARPHFGDGAAPRVTDLGRALSLYRRGCAGLWLALALLALVRLSS